MNHGKNNLIIEAFQKIDRTNFVLPEYKNSADLDIPLPIGFGQTISQPTTVRMMLEWLDTKPGEKVLDIGSGSGWTTALLSQIVGPKGKVYAVELVPELKKFGQENCQRIGVNNAEFFIAGGKIGLEKFAPYDRILVSASADRFPKEILDQLKVGGKLIIPIENTIFEIEKDKKNLKTIWHQGFVFVPLIES